MPLEVDNFYMVIPCVMNKEGSTVLHASITYTFKVQRCLQWGIAHHTRSASKMTTIHVQTFNHKVCLIETCYGITLMIGLHVLMEVPTILLLKVLCTRRKRIHIIGGWDKRIELIEIVKMLTVVHQPFWITKHGDFQ